MTGNVVVTIFKSKAILVFLQIYASLDVHIYDWFCVYTSHLTRVLMCIFMTGFVFTLHNLTDLKDYGRR